MKKEIKRNKHIPFSMNTTMDDILLYNARRVENNKLIKIIREIRYKKLCTSCFFVKSLQESLKPSTFRLLFHIGTQYIVELGLCKNCFAQENFMLTGVCHTINKYSTCDFTCPEFYHVCRDMLKERIQCVYLDPK